MYIDAHSHFHDRAFGGDRDEIFARAFSAGVEKIILVGTDAAESRAACALAEKYEGVWCAVGIHPHFFNGMEKELQNPNSKFQNTSGWTNDKIQDTVKKLRDIVRSGKKVVAIGEIGLDYHSHTNDPITKEQKNRQRESLIAQLELAKEHKLPVIIHCRDAYKDMYMALFTADYQLPIVLHCYQGDTEVTKKFLSLPGVYFSFAGNITYPVKKTLVETKDDIRETVKMIPQERILSETDSPYLAAQKYRGKRNESAFVVETVREMAHIRGEKEEDLCAAIEKNLFSALKI